MRNQNQQYQMECVQTIEESSFQFDESDFENNFSMTEMIPQNKTTHSMPQYDSNELHVKTEVKSN